jgi:cell division transport system permease protein
MQVTYVFSELGTLLKRNLSMTVAVIVTIWVSLTLVAFGLLLHSQVNKTENYLGSRLQITVFLCNNTTSSAPTCVNGAVTKQQQQQVVRALKHSREVSAYRYQSKQQAYAVYKQVSISDQQNQQAYFNTVRPKDMRAAYWVTLKNPQRYQGIKSQLEVMPGVDHVQDLHEVLGPTYTVLDGLQLAAIGAAVVLLISAVLQVSNTVRLAVFARRREIGIMRLVGASSVYIQLPFLLEAVIAALIGAALACATIALFVSLVVYGRLRGNIRITEWINWSDALFSMGVIVALGIVLAAIPTLVMSRKYLKV